MKVWEGETNESMKKGLGHYSSTSAWDGNIGVCGHNRGAKYTIGSIKDLEIGDTITYTTIYGTRTYGGRFGKDHLQFRLELSAGDSRQPYHAYHLPRQSA